MKIIDKIRAKGKPFYSLEFFPPKDQAQWPEFFQIAERLKAMDPLFASVTCGAGGSTQSFTLEIASRLKKDLDLEPMPHLTCTGANQEGLTRALDNFAAADIQNVLALRGDKPRDAADNWISEDFRHASDLVTFIGKYNSRGYQLGIGVAGYPAPHPESPTFRSDREHLAAKIEQGADFVVTQLFFDHREYFELVDYLQGRGITVPVIPGILPIQSMASIKRTLSMCGANIPGALYLKLEEANETGGTEAVRAAGLAFAVEQIKRLLEGGAPGIHLYTLNSADLCLRIMNETGKL